MMIIMIVHQKDLVYTIPTAIFWTVFVIFYGFFSVRKQKALARRCVAASEEVIPDTRVHTVTIKTVLKSSANIHF